MENKQELHFGDEVTIDFSDKPEYTWKAVDQIFYDDCKRFEGFFTEDTQYFIDTPVRKAWVTGLITVVARRNGLVFYLHEVNVKRITKKNYFSY